MSNESEEIFYDLTTAEGLAKAVTEYIKDHPSKTAMLTALHIMNPFVIPMMLVKDVIQKKVSSSLERTENVIIAQREAAVGIIKAGKENGASKVRVTLNQKAGIDIGGSLEGYSVKFNVGSDDNMTIEVDYA